jgi:hypothetical protein
MLLSISGLPYSIHHIFIDSSVAVRDGNAFRPDKVVRGVYGSSVVLELLCNEINNVSPMCLEPGKAFLVPTARYINTFLEDGK